MATSAPLITPLRSKRHRVRRLMPVAVVVLCAIGLGSSGTYFVREPANHGFLDHGSLVALHVVSGSVYLLLAPLQFVPGLRRRKPRYHRWAGRVLVIIAFVMGVSAIAIGLLIPYSGYAESVVITVFGTYLLACLWLGFRCIVGRDVAHHREWMVRAFSVALAIATQRLIFLPALLWMDDPTHAQIAAAAIAAWVAALTIHVVSAELWLGRAHGVTSAARAGAARGRPCSPPLSRRGRR